MEAHTVIARNQSAFTLIELLVILAIIILLISILIPSIMRAKEYARSVINANNQRQIIYGVTIYGTDNKNRCPDSVATTGFGSLWNWSEPTKLISSFPRSIKHYRSVSTYLGSYLSEAETMYCANAPRPPHKYLDRAWQEGEQWDNPDTLMLQDPLGGTFCYYWSYIGYLEGSSTTFRGPKSLSDAHPNSQILVSDYFGYDHWRSPKAYSSCERFYSSRKVQETWLLSSYWAGPAEEESLNPDIPLRAGYLDGHVGVYDSHNLRKMRVSLTPDGSVPYPDGVGPGIFFLPHP